MSDLRNDLRTRLFSIKPKTKIITVNGQEIEVRQPPVKAILDSADPENRKASIVRMIINYCYVPGTDEKVFEDADFDTILEMPFGSDWMALSTAIDDLVDVKKAVDTQTGN